MDANPQSSIPNPAIPQSPKPSIPNPNSPIVVSPPRKGHLALMPNVTVTRRLHFNAAHRVHNPALSDEENDRLFGKCNNPNWHGHNYVLEVSVKGPIEERTGYVLDLGKVKEIVTREVVDKIDHKNFNLDVEFMHGIIPTSENIAVNIWRILAPRLAPARLTRIRLWESENNMAEYEGE